MVNNAKSTINIARTLAKIVGSRDLTDALKEVILKANTSAVDLDFSEVEFVSRSAAHELLSMKEDLKRKLLNKKEINFVNANRDVTEMFRVVAANKAVPKVKPIFKAERVDIESLTKKMQTCAC